MNYDLRREYRWLVHDERYHATLWDCHGYISHRVDGKVRGQSSITSISYRVYILHVERRLPNYLFYLWYYVQYDLLADWQANRIGFHLKGSIGRKGKKKKRKLVSFPIIDMEVGHAPYSFSSFDYYSEETTTMTTTLFHSWWPTHSLLLSQIIGDDIGRRPGALSTDETQVFQTSLKNCIGKNSVDHGDPAAFFQPKRSVSLEGMCWLTALDINT